MPKQLYQVLSKWPDFAELYIDEEQGTEELMFVVIRKNSRQLHFEQMVLLQALERAGQTVRIRVGTVDLTLEQFEKGGTYNVQQSKSIMRNQGLANARSSLKRLLEMRSAINPDSPKLYDINRQISVYESMLDTGQPPIDETKLVESDVSLDKLVPLLGENISDEALVTVPWPILAKIKEPLHMKLWKRKLALVQAQEKTQNDPNKSITQGEDTVGEQNVG